MNGIVGPEKLCRDARCVSSSKGILFSIQIIYKKSSCSQQLPFRVPSTSLYYSLITLSYGSDIFLVVFNSNLIPLLKILPYLYVSLREALLQSILKHLLYVFDRVKIWKVSWLPAL